MYRFKQLSQILDLAGLQPVDTHTHLLEGIPLQQSRPKTSIVQCAQNACALPEEICQKSEQSSDVR